MMTSLKEAQNDDRRENGLASWVEGSHLSPVGQAGLVLLPRRVSWHELNGGLSRSPTTDYMKAREAGNGFSRNQSTRHSSGSRCD